LSGPDGVVLFADCDIGFLMFSLRLKSKSFARMQNLMHALSIRKNSKDVQKYMGRESTDEFNEIHDK
jgi:hypothetical protein